MHVPPVPKLISVILAGTGLLGCSIRQEVVPFANPRIVPTQICMIPAKGLRDGFSEAYRSALETRGFVTRKLPSDSAMDVCELSTRYIGRWSWDITTYMSYADIQVFENGRLVGRATYDARSPMVGFNKFIVAEEKIAELTEALFPSHRLPSAAEDAASALSTQREQ